MSFDISTHNLAEQVDKELKKFNLDDILKIWHTIGIVVKEQLFQNKGVRLPSFGTFTLPLKGSVPIFIMLPECGKQFRIVHRQPPTAANIPTTSLNFMHIREIILKNNAESPAFLRENIEKIYNAFLSAIKKNIFEGKSILLTIHRIAEITISQNELTYALMNDFAKLFNTSDPQTNKPNSIKSAGMKTLTRIEANNKGNISRNTFVENKSTRPQSAGRTSTLSGRPMSARSNVSNGSLTPRSTVSSSTIGRSATPNRNVRRGSVNSNSMRSSEGVGSCMTDARTLAARAIGNTDIIERVRETIKKRGGSNGIRSIAKLLAIMDDNGDKKLSKDELKYGLRDYGIDLKPNELEQLFQYFDRDRNGFISFDEFLVGLKGDLSDRRRNLVKMAFNSIDFDGSGVVDAEEILKVYNLNWDPEVREGRISVKEAAKKFMQVWDRHDQNGLVTWEEFEDYYKEISASIDDDDYFELMIRNAWRIAGGQGAAANTANRRVLVTHADGRQTVETVENELGMNARDMNDVVNRLGRQGIHSNKIDMYGSYQDMKDANPKAKIDMRNSDGIKGIFNYEESPIQNSNRNNTRSNRPSSAPNKRISHEQPKPQPQPPVNVSSSALSGSQIEIVRQVGNVLYNPPVNMEGLCAKLLVSAASGVPRLSHGSFMRRLATIAPSLSPQVLSQFWKIVDPNNQNSIEVENILNLFVGSFGKDKMASKGSNIIDRVKAKILERCGENVGIKGLARSLAIMDDTGDKKLTKEELKFGLQDYGINLNLRELDEIFNYFDRDRNGFVDIDELLFGIRGELNERRLALVKLAFNILDKDRSGVITMNELIDRYDCSNHPDVLSGRRTQTEVIKDFIRVWDRHDQNGEITWEEFEDYYKEISASIDGDDYFELMIRNAWRIAGGQGAAANTANRRVLVTHADGRQTVETVENELGMNARDMNDVVNRLGRQGIHSNKIDMYGSYQDDIAQPNQRQPNRSNNARPSHNKSQPQKYKRDPEQEKKKLESSILYHQENHYENYRPRSAPRIIRPRP